MHQAASPLLALRAWRAGKWGFSISHLLGASAPGPAPVLVGRGRVSLKLAWGRERKGICLGREDCLLRSAILWGELQPPSPAPLRARGAFSYPPFAKAALGSGKENGEGICPAQRIASLRSAFLWELQPQALLACSWGFLPPPQAALGSGV